MSSAVKNRACEACGRETSAMSSSRPSCSHGLVVAALLCTVLVTGAQSQCTGTPTYLSAQAVSRSLKYPAYGGRYANNVTCQWKIRSSSASSKLNVTVVSLNLQSSSSCLKDNLSIYDGESQYYPRLAKLCGSSSYLPFRSTGRYMFLRFRSDSSVTGYGFELRYNVLSVNSTTTRPTTPSVNGPTTNRTVNRTVTSTTTPRPSNNTPSTGQPNTSCSGLRSVQLGTNYTVSLYSPRYPDHYPSGSSCQWAVTATARNHVVRLFVVDIDTEESSRCDYDYLSVYDANYMDSDYLLRRLCGQQGKGQYVYSSGQHMFVFFRSDSSIQKRGVHVQVTAVPVWTVPSTPPPTTTTLPAACSSTQYLTATTGYNYLSSPNFPRNYSNNLDCSWRISSSGWGPYVRVRVLELDLERRYSNCDLDSLTFYDGSGPSSRLLSKLCGKRVGDQYIFATGPVMFLRFTTNSYNTGRGFRLDYKAHHVRPTTPLPSDNSSCSTYQPLTATVSSDRQLLSPNYPASYSNHLDCGWKIKTNEWQAVIRLRVVDLDLEQHADCGYDSLSVYDGSSPTSRRLRKFCGQWTNVAYIYSSSQSMYIRFKTDSSNSGRGFKLEYKAVLSSDVPHRPTTPSTDRYERLTLTAPVLPDTGYLQSASYPSYFHSYVKKMWTIRAWSGYIVNLRVLDLDLQHSAECDDNQVKVYDSDYSRVLATMCNYQFVGVDLYSSDRELYVYFTTGYQNNGRGFKLYYQSVSSLEASSTYSTRSPWDYPDPLDSTRNEIDNTAAIVGGVIGGVFILMLIVSLGLFFYCRAKSMSTPAASSGQTLAFRNPSATYNNNSHIISSNNISSSPGVYAIPSSPSAPPIQGQVVMGYAPPSYYGLQNNGVTFTPGTQAVAGAPQPAVPPPKYADAMIMSHPPAAGAIVGIPAQAESHHMTMSVSAPPPEADPLSPEAQPDSNPATVAGSEEPAGLESDYFTRAQSTGEEPHVYAELGNTNPDAPESII